MNFSFDRIHKKYFNICTRCLKPTTHICVIVICQTTEWLWTWTSAQGHPSLHRANMLSKLFHIRKWTNQILILCLHLKHTL